jgi:hypothetical protein
VDPNAVVREALELQIYEHQAEQAAGALGAALQGDLTPAALATSLLDHAAMALRIMVAGTDTALDLPELLARLALDGAVPEHRLDLLGETLTVAAATAGGLRPPVEALLGRVGPENLLFGAWLAVLTAFKVVSLELGRTEVDLVEEVIQARETY